MFIYCASYSQIKKTFPQETFMSLALDQLPSFKDNSAILYRNLIKFTTKYSEGHTFFFCQDSFPFQDNLYLLESVESVSLIQHQIPIYDVSFPTSRYQLGIGQSL